MHNNSPFDPHSPQSLEIARLFTTSLGIAAIIFLLVTGFLVYIIARYRWRPGQPEEPPQISGNRRLEIGWTIAPAVVLVIVMVMMIPSFQASAVPANQDPDIEVTGYQWWWDVRYPQAGIRTANEVHIPVGQRIVVRLIGGDVIHDFGVPQLARKMDMVPNHPNEITLFADQPGVYDGACYEYCGLQHAYMRFRVVAQPQNEYAAWVQQNQQPAAAATGAAQHGEVLFNQLTCVSCHAIGGTGMNAQVGPNLTHFASRQTIGAGILENTPDNVRTWLADPHAVKPGVLMPNLQLSQNDLRDMVAYMETLK